MKMRATLLIAIIFSGLLTQLSAQDTTLVKIAEPEFPNEPMLLTDSTFSLSAIPSEIGERDSKIKLSGTEMYYVFKTTQSTLRISSGRSVKFIVNHSPDGFSPANPKDYYRVYKIVVDEKKKKRLCHFMTLIDKGIKGIITTPAVSLPATFKKVRNNIYLISLDNLEKGEYAVLAGSKMFTFGID